MSIAPKRISDRYYTSLPGSVTYQPATGKVWVFKEFLMNSDVTAALSIRHFIEDGEEDGTTVTLDTYSLSSADTIEDKGPIALADTSLLQMADTNATGFGHFILNGVECDEDADGLEDALVVRHAGGSGNQSTTVSPSSGNSWLVYYAFYVWHTGGVGSTHDVEIRDASSSTEIARLGSGSLSEDTLHDITPVWIKDEGELFVFISGSAFTAARDFIEVILFGEEVAHGIS